MFRWMIKVADSLKLAGSSQNWPSRQRRKRSRIRLFVSPNWRTFSKWLVSVWWVCCSATALSFTMFDDFCICSVEWLQLVEATIRWCLNSELQQVLVCATCTEVLWREVWWSLSFKESLCGNSKTVMMAAISPNFLDYESCMQLWYLCITAGWNEVRNSVLKLRNVRIFGNQDVESNSPRMRLYPRWSLHNLSSKCRRRLVASSSIYAD